MLIEELLNRNRLEKLLRDSFGNYCVQTALDYAEPGQRMILVEGIRLILPLIRNTPYGKRIQSKLQREQMEAVHGGAHFGGGYNHGRAPVNAALIGNSIQGQRHHIPQQSLHASQLADRYIQRLSVYSLGQNGAAQRGIQSHQQLHLQQQHAVDHGYPSPQHMTNLGLGTQSAVGGGLGGVGGTAFGNSAYSNPLSGGTGFVISALNDPYGQRSTYPYAT